MSESINKKPRYKLAGWDYGKPEDYSKKVLKEFNYTKRRDELITFLKGKLTVKNREDWTTVKRQNVSKLSDQALREIDKLIYKRAAHPSQFGRQISFMKFQENRHGNLDLVYKDGYKYRKPGSKVKVKLDGADLLIRKAVLKKEKPLPWEKDLLPDKPKKVKVSSPNNINKLQTLTKEYSQLATKQNLTSKELKRLQQLNKQIVSLHTPKKEKKTASITASGKVTKAKKPTTQDKVDSAINKAKLRYEANGKIGKFISIFLKYISQGIGKVIEYLRLEGLNDEADDLENLYYSGKTDFSDYQRAFNNLKETGMYSNLAKSNRTLIDVLYRAGIDFLNSGGTEANVNDIVGNVYDYVDKYTKKTQTILNRLVKKYIS